MTTSPSNESMQDVLARLSAVEAGMLGATATNDSDSVLLRTIAMQKIAIDELTAERERAVKVRMRGATTDDDSVLLRTIAMQKHAIDELTAEHERTEARMRRTIAMQKRTIDEIAEERDAGRTHARTMNDLIDRVREERNASEAALDTANESLESLRRQRDEARDVARRAIRSGTAQQADADRLLEAIDWLQ